MIDRVLQKYVAAVLGFGFMAVLLALGLGSAILCLAASGVGYAAISLVHRRRLDRFTSEFMAERPARRRRDARAA